MSRRTIANESEFEKLMQEVDGRLQTEMVPIPSRPMRAESILAVQLGEPFVHPYPKREPTDGRYTGDDLTIRVNRWFTARYGNRLKTDFSPGRMVMMILGDPWVVRYPRIWGEWRLFLSATELSDGPGLHVHRAGQPRAPLRYNIVESIVDFPANLVNRLTDEDVQRIVTTWASGWEASHWIESVHPHHELVRLALSDLDSAVQHLSTARGDRGLAKWASLQAVEKMLKAYIALRNTAFTRSHDLAELASQPPTDDGHGHPPRLLAPSEKESAATE